MTNKDMISDVQNQGSNCDEATFHNPPLANCGAKRFRLNVLILFKFTQNSIQLFKSV